MGSEASRINYHTVEMWSNVMRHDIPDIYLVKTKNGRDYIVHTV